MNILRELQKGFTLMELLVVVAIIAVLMGIVSAAVSGTKSQSVEGQVKSDGKATQTAVDNFNNKSINTGLFPEKDPDTVVTTGSASNFHIYADVFAVGSEAGGNVLLRRKSDDKGARLSDKVTPSGGGTAVFRRRFMDFTSVTSTYDADGVPKTSQFVPDFLLKNPTSLKLKGDETKELGTTGNIFEEYIWVLGVNAPGQDGESRTIEVYRLVAAYCTGGSDPIPNVNQPVTSSDLLSSGDVQTLIDDATGCDSDTSTVNALVYEQLF